MKKRETLKKSAALVLKDLKIGTESFSQNPPKTVVKHVPTE